MKALCFITSAGVFYCEGKHPDKVAHILKNIQELGWTWNTITLIDMTPEAYAAIPATNASHQLFTPTHQNSEHPNCDSTCQECT